MAWAKLSDDFWCHPKVVGLSDRAFRLHVTAICWSAALETDGAVPRAVLAVLRGTPAAARELEQAGLWQPAADGWQIRNFLEYNPSHDELEAKRERRAAAGRRGAERRWQQPSATAPAPFPSSIAPAMADATDAGDGEPMANAMANAMAPAMANAMANAPAAASVCHDRVHAPDPTRSPIAAAADSLRSSAAAAAAAAARAGEDEAAAAAEAEPGGSDPLPLLLRHWERATGTTVTPMLADWLDAELGAGTPEEWLRDAIAETGANGVRAWKYTRSIVERWKAQGRDSPAPAPPPNRNRPQEVPRGEARKHTERSWADDPVLAEWRALGILAE